MKLAARIKSKYLTEIMQGRKTLEYRQFDGSDKMELTDERGRHIEVDITGIFQAPPTMEASIKSGHKDVKWVDDTPIMVIGVKFNANAKSARGLV